MGGINLETEKRKCGYCHENIDFKSRRCPFCGSLLNMKESNQRNESNQYTESNQNNQDNVIEKPVLDNSNTTKENFNFNRVYNYGENLYPSSGIQEPFPEKSLSNGMKVFLTVITSVVPGLGQIIGIIIAIIFMNSEEDFDKRSFGVALLVSSLIIFVVACLSCFVAILAAGKIYQDFPFPY